MFLRQNKGDGHLPFHFAHSTSQLFDDTRKDSLYLLYLPTREYQHPVGAIEHSDLL